MSHSLQFLVFIMAGWLGRQQQDLIDYLREENRILREQLGSGGLRLTDEQRRRLAVKGKVLGRPTTSKQIADLVVRMAEENPGWGYTRHRGRSAADSTGSQLLPWYYPWQ